MQNGVITHKNAKNAINSFKEADKENKIKISILKKKLLPGRKSFKHWVKIKI